MVASVTREKQGSRLSAEFTLRRFRNRTAPYTTRLRGDNEDEIVAISSDGEGKIERTNKRRYCDVTYACLP